MKKNHAGFLLAVLILLGVVFIFLHSKNLLNAAVWNFAVNFMPVAIFGTMGFVVNGKMSEMTSAFLLIAALSATFGGACYLFGVLIFVIAFAFDSVGEDYFFLFIIFLAVSFFGPTLPLCYDVVPSAWIMWISAAAFIGISANNSYVTCP